MSGIAGIIHFDGAPVEPGLIEKMTLAMARRGPDEQTHWVQGSVALGHCMLRTTPESLEEHQPLMSQDKRLVLVWDGRLDNCEELRRELQSAKAILRDKSDAEMALQSYAVWGEACPERLLGDFAFAIWDARQKRLFCARDQMGARPFYYVRTNNLLAFASEDEALLNLPGVSGLADEELIAYLLVPELTDANLLDSCFRDVGTLAPASFLLAEASGKTRTGAYWQLIPRGENRYASDEECKQAFLEVFGEAVRCRLRSTGDVAALMSGGMDSAAIFAMTRRLLVDMPGKQFHTYSTISDHPASCIESRCIQSMVRSLGANAHILSVPSFTGMVGADELADVAGQMLIPWITPSCYQS